MKEMTPTTDDPVAQASNLRARCHMTKAFTTAPRRLGVASERNIQKYTSIQAIRMNICLKSRLPTPTNAKGNFTATHEITSPARLGPRIRLNREFRTLAWSLQWKAYCSPTCQRTVVCVVLVPVDGPSRFIDRSHVWQALYLTDEICEQGRGIVPSPSESERKRHVQIHHRQDDNGFWAPPACASKDPSHAQAGRHETQDCCLIKSLLNDARGLQSPAITCMHHAVVERRVCRPWKPDKRRIH
jgi:hypothetical protein